MEYAADSIKHQVDINRERLFAPYAAGRSATWSCCSRTQDVVCLGRWLNEELRRMSFDDEGKQIQCRRFDRLSSSVPNLWELAAKLLNEAVQDQIPRYKRPCRRWG